VSVRVHLLTVAVVLTSAAAFAHHPVPGKFDEKKPVTLTGIVTMVDWRNPHVHIFMNVASGGETVNWAVELESPIELARNGWASDAVQPGDRITVQGIAARNGSRQVWGNSVVLTGTNRRVYYIKNEGPPPAPLASLPSSTALKEDGVDVAMDKYGLLRNLADAPKVAPMQPWALALYRERQQRFLQDDPMFLNCKPPGGPRQFQMPEGVQFVEDRQRQRIFVLIGGGNNNFRIIYLDGRSHRGQVGGDDDNPLYYGRSVAKWEGDTLVADTRGFNEDFWFTNGGLPHSDQLRLVERFTRTDYDTLKYEVTIEDPGAYTRPWSSSWTLRWVAGEELPRHYCQENRP